MIELRLIAQPGGGATLHLAGRDGWAAFEMERCQIEALRQACVAMLSAPRVAGSLAEFMDGLG